MPSTPTATDRRFQFIRRYPLISFFAWFFTVGQAFAFTPLIADSRGVDVPVQPFIVASTIFGLLLPALVITRIVEGPEAVTELLRRAIDVRATAAWYAVAVIAVPLAAVALTVALLGAPSDLSTGAVASAALTAFVPAFVLTFLPNNLWEEVAWTGFVQARLQARRGPWLAALIAGPLFALQHISGFVGGSVAEAVLVLVLLTVLVTPYRFLTGWVYNRTGNLFLVGLLHASGNAAAGGSGFGDGFLARLYPGEQLASMTHLITFAVLGLLTVIVTRGRLGQPRTQRHSTPAHPDDRRPNARVEESFHA
jgi:membrane protease YdiL (CAAX protease family)